MVPNQPPQPILLVRENTMLRNTFKITAAFVINLLLISTLSLNATAATSVLTATAKGDTATLKWNLAKNPVSQKILIQSTDGRKDGDTVILSPKSRSVTIKGLSFDANYTFTLTTKSPNSKLKVSLETGPSAPIVIEHRREGQNLKLNWQPVTNALGYDITVKSGLFSTKLSSILPEILITGVPADKPQEVSISSKGINSIGGTATMTIPSLAPGKVTGLSVEEISTTKKAILSWLAPSTGVTSYKITISSTPGGEDSFTIAGSNTSFDLGTFFYGTKYAIKVAAINKWGQGPAGTLNFNPTQTPTAPLDLKISITDNGFDLTWKAPLDAGDSAITAYIVEYDKGSGWERLEGTTSSLSARIGTLPLGKKIRVRVLAENSFGESEPSKISTATIPLPVIETPQTPVTPITPNPNPTQNPVNPNPSQTPNPNPTQNPNLNPNPVTPNPSPSPSAGVKVFPGSLCSPAGLTGVLLGKTYTCKSSDTDSALRWRE